LYFAQLSFDEKCPGGDRYHLAEVSKRPTHRLTVEPGFAVLYKPDRALVRRACDAFRKALADYFVVAFLSEGHALVLGIAAWEDPTVKPKKRMRLVRR
jgi:hypothetical protein